MWVSTVRIDQTEVVMDIDSFDAPCTCDAFSLWYTEDGLRVCQCGHPDWEHVDGMSVCCGDLTVHVYGVIT